MDLDPAWIAAQMDPLAKAHNSDQVARVNAKTLGKACELSKWDLAYVWLAIGALNAGAIAAAPGTLPGVGPIDQASATIPEIVEAANVSTHVGKNALAVLSEAGWLKRRFNGRGYYYEQLLRTSESALYSDVGSPSGNGYVKWNPAASLPSPDAATMTHDSYRVLRLTITVDVEIIPRDPASAPVTGHGRASSPASAPVTGHGRASCTEQSTEHPLLSLTRGRAPINPSSSSSKRERQIDRSIDGESSQWGWRCKGIPTPADPLVQFMLGIGMSYDTAGTEISIIDCFKNYQRAAIVSGIIASFCQETGDPPGPGRLTAFARGRGDWTRESSRAGLITAGITGNADLGALQDEICPASLAVAVARIAAKTAAGQVIRFPRKYLIAALQDQSIDLDAIHAAHLDLKANGAGRVAKQRELDKAAADRRQREGLERESQARAAAIPIIERATDEAITQALEAVSPRESLERKHLNRMRTSSPPKPDRQIAMGPMFMALVAARLPAVPAQELALG